MGRKPLNKTVFGGKKGKGDESSSKNADKKKKEEDPVKASQERAKMFSKTRGYVISSLNLLVSVLVCVSFVVWLVEQKEDVISELPHQVRMNLKEGIKHNGDLCITFLKAFAAEVNWKLEYAIGLVIFYFVVEIVSAGLLWIAIQGDGICCNIWTILQSTASLFLVTEGALTLLIHYFLHPKSKRHSLRSTREMMGAGTTASIVFVLFISWKCCLLYYVNRKHFKAPAPDPDPDPLLQKSPEKSASVNKVPPVTVVKEVIVPESELTCSKQSQNTRKGRLRAAGESSSSGNSQKSEINSTDVGGENTAAGPETGTNDGGETSDNNKIKYEQVKEGYAGNVLFRHIISPTQCQVQVMHKTTTTMCMAQEARANDFMQEEGSAG